MSAPGVADDTPSNAMHLFIVECRREFDPDEVRLGLVIASAIEEAEETCRRAYSQDGYAFFKVRLVVEGQFPGPAREIGFTGQKLPWRP